MALRTNILTKLFLAQKAQLLTETQPNHQQVSRQPVLSTALNATHLRNVFLFTSKSLQLLHVSSGSFEAEAGFYQAV